VSAQLILSPGCAGTWAEVFGLRWQPAEAKRSEDWSTAATALSDANQPGLVLFQSGVALRWPPQSKISLGEQEPQNTGSICNGYSWTLYLERG